MFSLRLNKAPGNLWKRYGIALVIILAFLLSSHMIESNALAKAERDAQVIDTSGKQRMLSLQIILRAQDYVSYSHPAVAEKLYDTIDEFEQSHFKLMEDAAQEASLGHLYLSRTPSTHEMVQNYIAIAREIPTNDYPHAVFAELREKGSGEVLERLDEAAMAFERRVQRQAQWAQQLQHLTLLIAAAVILLEAWLIFFPAHLLVDKTLKDLRSNAETDALTRLRNRAGFDLDIEAAM